MRFWDRVPLAKHNTACPEARNRGAETAPLGTNGKCSSDFAKGAVAEALEALAEAKKGRKKRAERYAALSQARHWLAGLSVPDPDKEGGWKVHQTWKCRFVRRAKHVGVHQELAHGKAFFGGLVTCGSVWACPVCAAKIQQRRREELQRLVDWAYTNNVLDREIVASVQREDGQPLRVVSQAIGPMRPLCPSMVTFTFPHSAFDRLEWLRNCMADAFKRLRSGESWQKFKADHRFGGLVRSTELTHGKNGWHLHTHELWLIDWLDKERRADFLRRLRLDWLRACMSAGLLGPDSREDQRKWLFYAEYSTADEERRAYLDKRRKKRVAEVLEFVSEGDRVAIHNFLLHSVDVRFAVSSSDYLCKQDEGRAWGVDRELATATSKGARSKGVHPHEFLVRQADGDKARYLEYVQGMHGASQLFWSQGLKARVGVEEKSDEEVSEEQTEKADLLGLLTPDQWKAVRGNDCRAELLDAAECGGWEAVVLLLRSLGCEPLPLGGDPAG